MIDLRSKQEYEDLKSKKTIFLFSAKWCPDCRFIEPFMGQIEEQFNEYVFVHVDRDQFIDICSEEGIYGIPSFIVYDKNERKGTFISKLRKTKAEIVQFLSNIH